MMSFALEFNSKEELTKAVTALWEEYGITGETEVMPMENGKWRLYIYSEVDLDQEKIQKLGGEGISSKSVFASARKKQEEE